MVGGRNEFRAAALNFLAFYLSALIWNDLPDDTV